MKKNKLSLAILFILIACSAPDGNKVSARIKFDGKAQGSYYAVTYYACDTLVSQVQIDSLLDAFNLVASIYEPRSIISRFNRNDTSVRADSLFTQLFNTSMKVSGRTGGAFDITVGQLVSAWGFGFKNREKIKDKVIDSLLAFTGHRKVRLEEGCLLKEDPRIMIDFNAIAQGFSVDLIAAFMEARGVHDYLIDIGGEVRAKGVKPGGEKWLVGIEKPAKDILSEQQILVKLHLNNLSLATSGNYRKYYEENGVRYSHIIDPKTGHPAQHNLLSVSVMAKECIIADAYATSFMVMGLDKTRAFLSANEDLNLEVYCIFSDDKGQMQVFMSKGFEEVICDL